MLWAAVKLYQSRLPVARSASSILPSQLGNGQAGRCLACCREATARFTNKFNFHLGIWKWATMFSYVEHRSKSKTFSFTQVSNRVFPLRRCAQHIWFEFDSCTSLYTITRVEGTRGKILQQKTVLYIIARSGVRVIHHSEVSLWKSFSQWNFEIPWSFTTFRLLGSFEGPPCKNFLYSSPPL